MNNKPTSFIEWIGYSLAGKFLSLAVLFCASVVAFLLLAAAEKTGIKAFYAAGALTFIIGFLAAIFTAKEVMIRMMDDRSMSFPMKWTPKVGQRGMVSINTKGTVQHVQETTPA